MLFIRIFFIYFTLTNKLIHYGKINQGNTDGEEPADDVRGRVPARNRYTFFASVGQ